MPGNVVRIMTESRADQWLVEGIFREESQRGTVIVESGRSSGDILMDARDSLLEDPEQVLAGIVNTLTDDPIRIEAEIAGPFRRMLSRRNSPHWCFALAIPTIETWIRTDPRIRAALDEDERRLGGGRGSDIAARFLELTAEIPFDREGLARVNPEFRRLDDFIRQHAPAEPVAASAD